VDVPFPWYVGHPDDVNRPGGRFVVDAEAFGDVGRIIAADQGEH
jgi:hypothetical protein